MINPFKDWGDMFARRETGTQASSDTGTTAADWQAQVERPTGRRSLLVPAWYRGVSLIMQTMGQLVIQYQRMSPEGGNFIEDRGYIDKRATKLSNGALLNYLLQVRPNPLMTASRMQEQIEFRKIFYGNAYVYIERDGYDIPKALWLCTGGTFDMVNHRYVVTYNDMQGIHLNREAPMRDVLHFKNVFLNDDFTMGIPTITYAFKALSIAATADEQALKDIAKGGRHKVILQEDKQTPTSTRGRANRGELKNMRDQFSEEWNGSDVVLLDNVADTKIISQTSQQLQLLEQRGHQVEDIARILGIPLIMMMESNSSNYKMPEHATQEFLLRTIQPRIRNHEDEYNSKMLTMEDFGRRRIHICEQPLRRLDAKGQAEIDKIHIETGWSPNEIRSQYDLPVIEGGDAHYVSTNLAEVGSEKLRGSATSPADSSAGSSATVPGAAASGSTDDNDKKGGPA